MKRWLLFVLLFAVAAPEIGCDWLKRQCRRTCITIRRDRFGIRIGCAPGCVTVPNITGVVAQSKIQKVVYRVDQAITKGTMGFGGACIDICTRFGEFSPECDGCRTTVGAGLTQPYFNLCMGTAYAALPASIPVTLTAVTDRGPFTSGVMTATKDRGTVRYDICGGENADFVPSAVDAQAFATSVANAGARQIYSLDANQAGGALEEFIRLKEGYEWPTEQDAPIDPLVWGVNESNWAFNGGGGDPGIGPTDGQITEGVLLPPPVPGGVEAPGPPPFTGFQNQTLKPCNSNLDCFGFTVCAADRFCRS